MKKIILFLLLSIFSLSFVYAGTCSYNFGGSIQSSLNNCLSDTTLIQPGGNLKTTGEHFSGKIYGITKVIASFLSLLAVLGIVYGSFLLVTSAGEDEKVKKGKDIIKWAIIGFLGVVLASSFIVLITKFIFDLGSK